MEQTKYRPIFGYDIRIRPEGAEKTHEHPCAVEGCPEEGVCHCPASPRNLEHRVWLCLNHAREHNQAWDYFEGMTDEEIARYQTEALTGHRPTWPLGKGRDETKPHFGSSYVLDDDYGLFGGSERPAEPRHPERFLTPMQRNAFEVLDLEISASLHEIKARYKELVKRFHPDTNGGDRGTEERLRQVIQAYGVLRASGLG